MLLRLHMLFRLFTTGGLPVRAAVFAWTGGPGARRPAVWPVLCLAALCCLAAVLAPSPAPAKNDASLETAQRRSISDGLELMRLGISNNICALTFDDGPSPYTAQLLDVLAEYHIPATFFVVGYQVQRRPELIRRMLAEGHEVGNHSFSHATLRKQSSEVQQADLLKLDALLRELGAAPRFVRPPFGFYDHNTINVVQEMDGHIVMWTADSQDWRNSTDINGMLSHMQMLYNGAPLRGVFLFHDTHRLTVEHMREILDALLAAGCRFVTLSEYIDSPLGGAGDAAVPPLLEVNNDAPEKNVNFALEGRLDAQPQTTGKGARARGDGTGATGSPLTPQVRYPRAVRTMPPYPPPADAAPVKIPDVSALPGPV